MAAPRHSLIGQSLDQIDTPALVLDLDALERNLQRMAELVRGFGCRLRPHAKTHKSVRIAARQIELGAVGVCCQKVAEAERLVAGGIGDVLVTNEIAGKRSAARIARLAAAARIGVCVDHPDGVAELAEAASALGARIDVLVEIDVGQRRCGVEPGEPAVRLARKIAESPGLNFAGLQAYHGAAQHFRSSLEREAAIRQAAELTSATIIALRRVGLEPAVVGGAGTGTFALEGASGVWNELQPGSYAFMDADYARNRDSAGGPFSAFEHALFVLATVISRPVPERAVLDAGHKALSNDSGFPTIQGLPAASYGRPSDEHGVLDLSQCAGQLARGDRVWLVPGHCDPTVNLHDQYICVRGLGTARAHVAEIWPVDGRGALT